MPDTPKALDGVRVLDASSFIAGPFAAAVLGEFGAEVIKVENPAGGDPWRRFGTATEAPDRSLAWLSEARNKLSVTLNLRQARGAALFKRLVADADVVVENFRPGTMERWGLGFRELSAVNPGLVMVRVSGYGQTGPYSDRPGFARIGHAVGGLTYLSGLPGEIPVTPGSTSLGDYITGLYGAVGALVALRHRDATGQGQVVDMALYESVFRVLDELVPRYAAHGHVREPEGTGTVNACPHGHFATSDGQYLAIACTTDKMFQRLTQAMDRPDLWRRFGDQAARLANRDAVLAEVDAWTGSLTRDQVMQRCIDADVPSGPINSIADIFQDPHFAAREDMVTVHHPVAGEVVVPNVFPKLSATPGAVETLGPALGEHNRSIYGERLGLSDDEMAELKDQGVI